MTTQEFKKIALNKLNAFSTADLVAEVKKLSDNLAQEADIVLSVVLDVLMERLPENEFIELCESL